MVWEANMINYLQLEWDIQLLLVRCLGCCKREQDGAFQLPRVIALRMGELLLKPLIV